MPEDKPDGVIVDAADAVTLNQDVEWERCARLAAPASRGVLDNLRTLSRAFPAGGAAEAAPETAPLSGSEAYGGTLLWRFLRALVAIAAVEVVVALALLPWIWTDYRRDHGDYGVWLMNALVTNAATAGLLLLAGLRDRRTWLLGAYFLLTSTIATLDLVIVHFWSVPAELVDGFLFEMPASAKVLLLLNAHPYLFAPAFLWAFARECPRIHRRTRLDDLARRMVSASVGVGCVLWAACAVGIQLAWAGYGRDGVWLLVDVAFAALSLQALAAVAVIALRARTAPADEVRRVTLFAGAFCLFISMEAGYDVVEVFTLGSWSANYAWSPYVAVLEQFRFPGMALLWYSVLAARVPHPREVLRAFYRRLLLRPRLLAALAAAPALALGVLAAGRPERAVGDLAADPLVAALAAACGAALLLAAGRERILTRLDAWVVPETADQRQVLAAATAALAQAERIEAVGRTITRAIDRGCGAPAALLVAGEADAGARDFEAVGARMAPLARGSAIVHMLERGGGSLRVHPGDAAAVFGLLPRGDADWVAASGADAVAAVIGPGAEVLGMLVVRLRFDDRIVRSADIPFLEALAAAGGIAIARLRSLRGRAAGSLDGPPAHECSACGCLAAAGAPRGCACGFEYVETAVPLLLAGKYRLTRRLGAGGMGVIYAARDVRLQRDVAVKGPPGVSVARLMALRSEGWAMATVQHPALAQIHGIESWRGRPLLVVEFLPGGTLEDRLRRGLFAPARALAVAAFLAEGVAALHAAGYLHRDIKPGNIAFTADGAPRLLDFGLAGEADGAVAGGTPRYASPEVLSGRPAAEADDVWSLCVVLYEMATGRHPFAGAGEVTERILRQRISVPAARVAGSGPPAAAARYAGAVLTAGRSSRPATARAFADALHGVLRKNG